MQQIKSCRRQLYRPKKLTLDVACIARDVLLTAWLVLDQHFQKCSR